MDERDTLAEQLEQRERELALLLRLDRVRDETLDLNRFMTLAANALVEAIDLDSDFDRLILLLGHRGAYRTNIRAWAPIVWFWSHLSRTIAASVDRLRRFVRRRTQT